MKPLYLFSRAFFGWITIAGIVTSRGADRFPYLRDLAEARVIAAAEKKPLFIVFRCEP